MEQAQRTTGESELVMIANQDNYNQEGKQLVKVRRAKQRAAVQEIKHSQEAAMQREGTQVEGEKEQDKANVHKTFSLTRVQQKVMDVITSAKYGTATNEEKAKALGISERRLYQVMADPQFAEVRRNLLQHKIQAQADSFVEAAAQTARLIGREGDFSRRLMLSMSGDYVERKQQDVNVKGVLVGVVSVSMEQL